MSHAVECLGILLAKNVLVSERKPLSKPKVSLKIGKINSIPDEVAT